MLIMLVCIACLGTALFVFLRIFPRPHGNCAGCRRAAEHNDKRYRYYSGMDSFDDIQYCPKHRVSPFSTRRRKR